MINQDLLSWYVKNSLEDIDPEASTYDHLRKAPLKSIQQIERLCNKDPHCMMEIIRLLVKVPLSKKVDTFQKKYRRKKRKNSLQIKQRERKKWLDKRIEAIAMVYDLDKNIDYEALSTKAHRRVAEIFDPTVLTALSHKVYSPGKTNLLFNGLIFKIYEISRRSADEKLSDNLIYKTIAALFSSLKIKNTKGSLYSRQSIYNIVSAERDKLHPPLL